MDVSEFFAALDRNLENVDSFHNDKLADARQRLSRLRGQYGNVPETSRAPFFLDKDETEELIGALIDLRQTFRNLQWFGEINRKGFVKITKKLDKKVPSSTAKGGQYVTEKVDSKPFARGTSITPQLEEINQWLSALFASIDAKLMNDSVSEESGPSLTMASVKGAPSVPQATLDALDQAARADDVESLEAKLKAMEINEPAAQSVLPSLLQRSISSRSIKCIEFALSKVDHLGPDDINARNCIHRLVIQIGKSRASSLHGQTPSAYPLRDAMKLSSQYLQPAASPAPPPKSLNENETTLLSRDDEAVRLLIFILDKLSPGQRDALKSKDALGRLPIHYAAHFGFVVLCEIIIDKMKEWGQFDVRDGIDSPGWLDKDGHGPIHLSVIGGHPKTTQVLLNAMAQERTEPDGTVVRAPISKSGALLALATKANFGIIAKMLMEAGIDVNWQDASGDTALHIAARYGNVECVRVLVEGTKDQKANIEIQESTYEWTPLDVAAVDGHIEVVKLLVEAGADIAKADSSGWTAQEHAALRGHTEIAQLLARQPEDTPVSHRGDANGTPELDTTSTQGRHSNGVPSSKDVGFIKSYGNKYLTDDSLVLVSLGSMDMRKHIEAVMLEKVPLNEAHNTGLDTALSVVVTASNAKGEPAKIDLPVHETIATEPVVFRTQDISKVTITFDIVPTYSGNQQEIIARATARLGSIRPTVGAMRMNLKGDVEVPIIMRDTLASIGTVYFNFLVVTPFSHPNLAASMDRTFWRKLSDPMVIGHRGLGKNIASTGSLQLGENTVPSFIAAANLGAQYVEFDVQLTKDHVPVIYHDFLVSETGIDAPVHALTLEQFLHINSDSARGVKDRRPADLGVRQRSNSVDIRRPANGFGAEMLREHTDMEERMKHTRDFKQKGYKGNSRGNFIQAPFATLEDLFRQIPENVGFNVELKYPMLHESEEHEMETFAVEINEFCDTVLSKVYELAGDRHIILSSFNPDICLCMSFKQPSFPVMFLTDAGTAPVSDVRASSLQEAVRFASRWDLLGIVSAAEPLVLCPRLIKVVKQRGLVCVSYGMLNNDSQTAEVCILLQRGCRRMVY